MREKSFFGPDLFDDLLCNVILRDNQVVDLKQQTQKRKRDSAVIVVGRELL